MDKNSSDITNETVHYNSEENLLDRDVDTDPLKFYSKNPTSTIFKKNYSFRLTHYNKWTQLYDFGLSRDIHIVDMYTKNIHMYNNLSLILTFGINLEIVTAFSFLTFISLKIGNLVTINLPGHIIYEIICMNYKNKKKIAKILKHKNQLIIPLQTLISQNDLYISANHNIEIHYKYKPEADHWINNVSVGLVSVYLTSEEKRRYQFCGQEYMANRYYFERHRIEKISKIAVPVLLPIKTIIIIPKNPNYTIDINIEFRNFIRSSYNYFSDGIDIHSNNYYMNLLIPHAELTTNNIPPGKLITKNKNLYLDIKTDNPNEITIIYCCHDYLRMESDCVQYGGCLVNRINENYYPLTKISENKFIEGYWFPLEPTDKDYDISYPKPISSIEPISIDFTNKLILLTNTVATTESYYGSSTCRLCQCSNGSEEHTLIFQEVQFIYPSGLIHYYKDHNVHPSKEFYNFVMNYPIVNKLVGL